MPATMSYGARMHALRLDARRWVWDGEYRSHAGAAVGVASGDASELRWSAFRAGGAAGAAGGSCGVVLANYGEAPLVVTVTPAGECAGGALDRGGRWRLVDDTAWAAWGGAAAQLTLPPLSAGALIPTEKEA